MRPAAAIRRKIRKPKKYDSMVAAAAWEWYVEEGVLQADLDRTVISTVRRNLLYLGLTRVRRRSRKAIEEAFARCRPARPAIQLLPFLLPFWSQWLTSVLLEALPDHPSREAILDYLHQ